MLAGTLDEFVLMMVVVGSIVRRSGGFIGGEGMIINGFCIRL